MSYANERLPREKVFRDPVHNYIYVENQVILDLINTREFQRLRRIKQLGTTSFTFHGAEHTRFGHSLGVYEVAREICDHFQRNYPTKAAGDGLWDDSERLVALCAALLHDIGHGPYSHTFEHIFQTNHEAITVEILTSEETEVNRVLRSVSPEFPEKVASVIQKTYANKQVVQMISSQLDADRMDYLLRDAYYTGVKYGTFDLQRVLRSMKPYQDGIAFDISGKHAVEDFIVSRFQMYQQVYFHPVSRSMEVILDHLLQRAKEIYEAGNGDEDFVPTLLIPFFEHRFSLEDYLNLDDGVFGTYFINWRTANDQILADLSHRFLDRKPLKSVEFDSETATLIPHLRALISDAGYDSHAYTAINNSYDLPYDDAYDPKMKKPLTQIELMRSDGSLVELSQESAIVNAISGKLSGDQRFFFPKEMLIPEDGGINLFQDIFNDFGRYIHNNQLTIPKE
ncbi:HD domain-containing protein [Levilactobacillus bambusae]|uniref:HD domain-containing protein n=1 Tax=Levilactobacillus bambusae TaxID=2024736 RepID=A0A2V1MW72_9LACO|nr:HD domain-containing protein [Levilactobacillus bambusae]PWF99318.1 hypothetical protein DCM90_09430 [Levilactobacillus bambusae]